MKHKKSGNKITEKKNYNFKKFTKFPGLGSWDPGKAGKSSLCIWNSVRVSGCLIRFALNQKNVQKLIKVFKLKVLKMFFLDKNNYSFLP